MNKSTVVSILNVKSSYVTWTFWELPAAANFQEQKLALRFTRARALAKA